MATAATGAEGEAEVSLSSLSIGVVILRRAHHLRESARACEDWDRLGARASRSKGEGVKTRLSESGGGGHGG